MTTKRPGFWTRFVFADLARYPSETRRSVVREVRAGRPVNESGLEDAAAGFARRQRAIAKWILPMMVLGMASDIVAAATGPNWSQLNGLGLVYLAGIQMVSWRQANRYLSLSSWGQA